MFYTACLDNMFLICEMLTLKMSTKGLMIDYIFELKNMKLIYNNNVYT